METGRWGPELTGSIYYKQAGTDGTGKYRCKHRLSQSKRGWVSYF